MYGMSLHLELFGISNLDQGRNIQRKVDCEILKLLKNSTKTSKYKSEFMKFWTLSEI